MTLHFEQSHPTPYSNNPSKVWFPKEPINLTRLKRYAVQSSLTVEILLLTHNIKVSAETSFVE